LTTVTLADPEPLLPLPPKVEVMLHFHCPLSDSATLLILMPHSFSGLLPKKAIRPSSYVMSWPLAKVKDPPEGELKMQNVIRESAVQVSLASSPTFTLIFSNP